MRESHAECVRVGMSVFAYFVNAGDRDKTSDRDQTRVPKYTGECILMVECYLPIHILLSSAPINRHVADGRFWSGVNNIHRCLYHNNIHR